MNKKILMIVGSIVLLVIIAGLATYILKGKSVIPNVSSTQVKQLTVDSAIEKLKATGFTVGDKQTVYYQMIGAYNGTTVSVNGTDIDIYEFTEAQKEAKDAAIKELSTTLATVDSNFFVSGRLVVEVFSGDKTILESIKNALEK